MLMYEFPTEFSPLWLQWQFQTQASPGMSPPVRPSLKAGMSVNIKKETFILGTIANGKLDIHPPVLLFARALLSNSVLLQIADICKT